ncbi:RTC4-like domain-containing protein [Aspergillus granulosus]|uniref:Restriction of telomere capping protein 4 n=1 Tax=Aspergillus granulosus TaxID=176169 RepID=A0ABR4I4B1_9EURO
MVSLRERQNAKPVGIDDSTDDESSLSSVNEDLLDGDLSEASQPTPRNPRKPSAQTDSRPRRPEPATDDEPLSSSDEDEPDLPGDDDDGITPRKIRQAGPTLEEKLAQEDSEEKKSRTPRSSRKRTAKDMLGSDDTKGDGIFDFLVPSQQSHKRLSYGSRYRKTPSSSMISRSPSGSVRPKSVSGSVAQKTESPEKKEEDETEKDKEVVQFKFPRELPDPASASSFSAPTSSAWDQGIADTDDEDGDSVLSSAKSYPSLDDIMNDAGKDKEEDELPREYICPMCGEPVDPGLLLKFEAQPRQRFRDQQAFCDSHKKSVEDEWRAKGYPTINWEKFDERIQSHFDDLEKLLAPESSSYYRNVLISTLKSGKAKNFRLTLSGDSLETISCGYYGTRGSEKMLQAISSRFARKLSRLAKEDQIINQAGPVAYSQSVLVPELAVRLIKEDMNVDEEAARQIMRDSNDLGEKVNFALNDTVHSQEEKETEAAGRDGD